MWVGGGWSEWKSLGSDGDGDGQGQGRKAGTKIGQKECGG